jgi:DnaJ-class molecular chaperone
MKENFDLLGISDQSTIAEIKKAYRTKAKEFHPDVNKLEGNSAKFIAITQAYDKLIDYKEGRTSINYQAFYEDSYEVERGKKARFASSTSYSHSPRRSCRCGAEQYPTGWVVYPKASR